MIDVEYTVHEVKYDDSKPACEWKVTIRTPRFVWIHPKIMEAVLMTMQKEVKDERTYQKRRERMKRKAGLNR